MNTGETISAVISSAAVLLMTAIARALIGIRHDLSRYMAEHMWLLATTLWTRDKVQRIMRSMDMAIEDPPPADLPPRRLLTYS
jgi:hypothetical protein